MKQSTSGFTIVELLIVIVVIAILATISVVAYRGIQERAQVSKVQSSLKQVYTKAALAHASTGNWPTRSELKTLIADVVPDVQSSDFLYCVDSSENFALAAYRPLTPSPGNAVHYVSPQKSGLTSAVYTMTQASTWGSICDAVLPGYTTGAWYNNM